MHDSVLAWVKRVVAGYDIAHRMTLECGSFNVNGSVRPFFTGPYVGIDTVAGPGVDKIANAEALTFGTGTFDTVVSTEMIEHVKRPWRAFAEMARVVRNHGLVIVSGRGFDERGAYGIHDYPADYNRFSLDGVRVMVEDACLDVIELHQDPDHPGYFLLASK